MLVAERKIIFLPFCLCQKNIYFSCFYYFFFFVRSSLVEIKVFLLWMCCRHWLCKSTRREDNNRQNVKNCVSVDVILIVMNVNRNEKASMSKWLKRFYHLSLWLFFWVSFRLDSHVAQFSFVFYFCVWKKRMESSGVSWWIVF